MLKLPPRGKLDGLRELSEQGDRTLRARSTVGWNLEQDLWMRRSCALVSARERVFGFCATA
jgi:hypothetical protein